MPREEIETMDEIELEKQLKAAEKDLKKAYETLEKDPTKLTNEQALLIIDTQREKMAMLDKNIRSAYERARFAEENMQKCINNMSINLNVLKDKLKMDYRTSLLMLNDIQGGIYNGN